MERKLPKNVRQIGNVSDTPKIYVEDYVDTFLNQICEKVEQEPIGAFLIGETAKDQNEEYIYIYGAVQMHNLEINGKDYVISEETWKNAYEDCKQYFEDGEMLGWFVTAPGETTALSHNLAKLHKTSFPKKNTILIVKEPLEKDEMYYVHKFNELLPMGGHYTYYEKNPSMQNYMISNRKKNGVTPSETVEDRAAQDFRSLVRTREELRTQKHTSHLIYAGSAILILVMIVMGITTINNFDKMKSVQESLANITGSVAAKEDSSASTDQNKEAETETSDTQNDKKDETSGEASVNNPNEPNEDTEQDAQTAEASSAAVINDETKMPQTIGQEEVAAEKQESTGSEGSDENSPDENGEDGVYIVEAGDTLALISQKMYGDITHVDNICNMNGLTDSNLIYIGQKLLIP